MRFYFILIAICLLFSWSCSKAAASTGPIYDYRRVNHPMIPFALDPLQWGSVTPLGWIRQWAMYARNGAASPTKAAFATLQNGKVNGWRNGRPAIGGFWDEDSAYWIDGMTRLGLVLHDKELLSRVKEDFQYVIKNPFNFHNTWKNDVVEGWVRSIYSRGMLAYFDGTGDADVIPFLEKAYTNYTPANSTHIHQDQEHQGSRSMTQMEALLEGHAFGGSKHMLELGLALAGRNANNGGYNFSQELLSGCLTDPDAIMSGACEQHAHGVTFNEVAKLFAMAYSWGGNTSLLHASLGAFDMIEQYDVQPHGVNSADEDMNGISPGAGTETCDVSDFLYSNTWMLRITGDGKFGDRLEKAFHNAAPATVRTFLCDNISPYNYFACFHKFILLNHILTHFTFALFVSGQSLLLGTCLLSVPKLRSPSKHIWPRCRKVARSVLAPSSLLHWKPSATSS